MTQQTEAENIPEEVADFCNEADALVRAGDPDEAQRRLNFALDTLRNLVRPRAQARVLEAFAHLHRSVGRMAEAESALRAALACFLKLGDRAAEARMLGELASMRISQGDLEDGGFWVECPSIPGCSSQGDTVEEALDMIRDAISACLEVGAGAKGKGRASA